MRAAALYRHAAEAGYAGAQHCVALCYLHGASAPDDDAEVLFWFRRAAHAGKVRARCCLGLLYAKGDCGLACDQSQAAAFLRQAAAGGGVLMPQMHSSATVSEAGASGKARPSRCAQHR